MSVFDLFGEVDISHALEVVASGVEAAVEEDRRKHGGDIHRQACSAKRSIGQCARQRIREVAKECGVCARWLLDVCPPKRGSLRDDRVVGAASVRKV